MNLKKALKDLLFATSVYYTAISMGFILPAQLLGDQNDTTIRLLTAKQFLHILLFAAMMGIGYAVLRIETLPAVPARCIHAGCYLVGFVLFVVLSGMKFQAVVITSAIFVLLYAALTLIWGKLFGRIRRQAVPHRESPAPQKDKSGYTSQFGK